MAGGDLGADALRVIECFNLKLREWSRRASSDHLDLFGLSIILDELNGELMRVICEHIAPGDMELCVEAVNNTWIPPYKLMVKLELNLESLGELVKRVQSEYQTILGEIHP